MNMDKWGFYGPVNDFNLPQPAPFPVNVSPSSLVNQDGGDSHDDYDLSDVVLKYISQMLMEEDMEDKTCMFQESSAALQAAEKSLYDVLGEKYPPSPKHDQNTINFTSQSSSQSSHSSEGFVESPESILRLPEMFSDSESVMQFRKGFEEASKFIPSHNSPLVDVERHGYLFLKEEAKDDLSRGKKNPFRGCEENGRSRKLSAVFTESTVSREMFDKLVMDCKSQNEFRESLQNDQSKNGTSRGKKNGRKEDVVDLRTLLTLCAQSVAANDRRNAVDLLKQIRQHSSPIGDGMQRLAHYFSNGLEARLAGSGTETYTALLTRPTSAADVLKAYHLFLAACPFRKFSNFFCNRTIWNLAQKSPRLHIVDFGILYGFQWPGVIRRLSALPGGPPRLRITGIELPQPGFRPAQRVEETGRRLANYAETFNVPFEFNAIAQKWDSIRVEDIKIDDGEVLVVNCMFRLKNLLDETVLVDCPRNKVLNLIRKMNPKVFIHGITNGAYSAPFFITRFREALFHFSTLFDMLETTIPREVQDRILIEREFFGREAINVIASEGLQRIERPETYKQWQVRIMRAGFRQLPLDDEIMRISKERIKTNYNKDFVIDEDSQWMLQGWKGRIVFALSSWESA